MIPQIADARRMVVLRLIQQANGTATLASVAETIITNHSVDEENRSRVYSFVADAIQLLTKLELIILAGGGKLAVTSEGVQALIAFRNFITPYLP